MSASLFDSGVPLVVYVRLLVVVGVVQDERYLFSGERLDNLHAWTFRQATYDGASVKLVNHLVFSIVQPPSARKLGVCTRLANCDRLWRVVHRPGFLRDDLAGMACR